LEVAADELISAAHSPSISCQFMSANSAVQPWHH